MGHISHAYYFKGSSNRFAPNIAALLQKQYRLQRQMEVEGGLDRLPALCTLIEKLMKLCRSQNEWWVYLESVYCLSSLYDQTGRSVESIPLIMEYLAASKEHIQDAMEKHPLSGESIESNHCFNLAVIATSFRDFYQFYDYHIDKLLQIFADTANSGESKRSYYKAKLKIDFMNQDCKAAKRTYSEFSKFPITQCYMCNNSVLIEYYVMMDQPDQAIAWIEKMLRQDVPKDALERFSDCIWLLPSTLYHRFLYATVKHGKIEPFLQYKDQYCDIIMLDSKSASLFYFLVLAVNKEYSRLEEMLQKFCENMNLINGESPFEQLVQYLCYSAYFYNLHKTGVDFVQLVQLKNPLNVYTENGAYSTAALAKYMQEAADLLGSKFDKSRKQFSYQKLKNTYMQLADMQAEI